MGKLDALLRSFSSCSPFFIPLAPLIPILTLCSPRPQFNMHEYFLTALVSPLNVDRALRILQGYSAQRPHASVVRRVILEGPRLKNTKGIDQRWIQKQPSQKHPIWRALSDVLTKQAYLITLDYEVDASMFDAEAEG